MAGFDSVWVEKYRPTTLEDVILPKRVKKILSEIIASGNIPNCVFTSESPGTGKTTSARALCNDLGADVLYVNASMENSVDDVRNKVFNFASTYSLESTQKVIILDEADRLSNAAQDALKGMIEQVHDVCRFIFTANNRNGLIAPLLSRCTLDVEFVFTEDEKNESMLGILSRSISILDAEIGKDNYDRPAIALVVKTFSPDNRKILQTLQEIAVGGRIDMESVVNIAGNMVDRIVESVRKKNFIDLKEVAFKYNHRFSTSVYRDLLFALDPHIATKESKAMIVEILNDYMRAHKTVPDKFIHFYSMFVSIGQLIEMK